MSTLILPYILAELRQGRVPTLAEALGKLSGASVLADASKTRSIEREISSTLSSLDESEARESTTLATGGFTADSCGTAQLSLNQVAALMQHGLELTAPEFDAAIWED